MCQAEPIASRRWLHVLSVAVAMLTFALNGANARAETFFPTDYRYFAAGEKFDGVRQYAVAFKIRPPRRLRASHLELAVGSITSADANRAFVSFGPVWHVPVGGERTFVEFGISPTLISGSDFNGRDLGGNFHFTSSIAVGARFGRQQTIALSIRAQHTSNGGLNDTNPGIDMLGINVAFNFTDR